MIRDLRATLGTTFVIATHDPTIAAAADWSIHIVDGLVAGAEGDGLAAGIHDKERES